MSVACEVCGKVFDNHIPLAQHKASKGHGKRGIKNATARAVNGKATNLPVTPAFLDARAQRALAAGYAKQKWISFCERVMGAGLKVSLYEARATVSKYITVSDGRRQFKVRFSNHRPIKAREADGDCDFFVGVCNSITTTTDQAADAVRQFFGMERL
jgi:hypothetical protein